MAHQEEQALLKAYIAEWRKFFTQCNYLPTPFRQLEASLRGKTTTSMQKKNQADESIVRKVGFNFVLTFIDFHKCFTYVVIYSYSIIKIIFYALSIEINFLLSIVNARQLESKYI